MAISTQTQNENEEGSHERSKHHGKVVLKYTAEMRACCDNKNSEKGMIHTLENISTNVRELRGGDPCEEIEAEEACNVQCCDGDCELSAWCTWSA